MSATGEVGSSDESSLIDGDLYTEISSTEHDAYRVDELAQHCFKCKELVTMGTYSAVGFVHLTCAHAIESKDIQAYQLSSFKSPESFSDKKIDLKAGKHLKFNSKKLTKQASKSIYAIRENVFVDDHQKKHISSWPGSAARGGTQFPKQRTLTLARDKFVQLLNQVIDSKAMVKVLSAPPPKHGSLEDVIVQLKTPLKYGSREGPMSRKRVDRVRVQISYEAAGWFIHMYPVKVS